MMVMLLFALFNNRRQLQSLHSSAGDLYEEDPPQHQQPQQHQ